MKFSFLQSKNMYPFFVVFCLFNAPEIKSMQQKEEKQQQKKQIYFEEHKASLNPRRKLQVSILVNPEEGLYLTGAQLYQAAKEIYKDNTFTLLFGGRIILDDPKCNIMEISKIGHETKFDVTFLSLNEKNNAKKLNDLNEEPMRQQLMQQIKVAFNENNTFTELIKKLFKIITSMAKSSFL